MLFCNLYTISIEMQTIIFLTTQFSRGGKTMIQFNHKFN